MEDKLWGYLREELDFNSSESIIKIKKNGVCFEYIIWYGMYVEQVPDMDMLMEDYTELEEDIFAKNVANDLTVCLIPKISELEQDLRGEALLRAKEVLEKLGEKIQQNFNVEPWNVKLNIKSRNINTIKKLTDKIEKEVKMTSARYNDPEENIDGEVILSIRGMSTQHL